MIMGLRGLDLKDVYRSDRDNLLRDFYDPCISKTIAYDRAVGYFTSTSLALAAQGVSQLERRGGKIRIIASPHLSDEDAEQIAAGYEHRAVVEHAILRELDQRPESDLLDAKLGLLGRLIAAGILEFKIAFVVRDGQIGIYHEKLAIFTDEAGDSVATSGSSNETKSAYLANFESFEVFRSWEGEDVRRLHRIKTDFEALWADETPNLKVFEFPDVAKDRLVSISISQRTIRSIGNQEVDPELDDTPRIWDGQKEADGGLPVIPPHLKLRDYQEKAIRSWFSANGRGMWEMATGTGKTITALAAMTRVARFLNDQDQPRPMIVVTTVPYQHLVDQWADEFKAFGVQPIVCMGSRDSWIGQLQAAQERIRSGALKFLAVVTANRTFSLDAWQQVFDPSDAVLMLIGDEAHNLGSQSMVRVLPERAQYRLGLSATPERWFDEEGTAQLANYFGDVTFTLGMREALDIGALTPYRYHPVVIELDPDEHAEYVELTYEISKLAVFGDDELRVGASESSRLEMLLFERSRLLGAASGKLPALRSWVERFKDSWFQLVYCAEVSIPGPDGVPERQIDAATRLIGLDLGLSANVYFSETPRAERSSLLRRFETGNDLRFLVSMRCLDEGVDIPDARVAYLIGSSTNPRQFIQRRGRILRRAPGKDSADIVDFVVVPPGDAADPTIWEIERKLMRRELGRVVEFASLALNGPEAMSTLLELRTKYQLLDM